MPIIIREIIIKTEIGSAKAENTNELSEAQLQLLRSEILSSCKKLIVDKQRRNSYTR